MGSSFQRFRAVRLYIRYAFLAFSCILNVVIMKVIIIYPSIWCSNLMSLAIGQFFIVHLVKFFQLKRFQMISLFCNFDDTSCHG